MTRRKVDSYLSKEQMQDMTTARLLAYRKRLLGRPEWRDTADNRWWWAEYERALREAKEILDTREHVRKKESRWRTT